MDFDALFPEQMDFPLTPPDEGTGWPEEPAARRKAMARQFPHGGGVYLLTDGQDRFIQLACAADLRRALVHRLIEPTAETPAEEPADRPTGPLNPRKLNLQEIVRRIRWQPAHSQFEITYHYYRLARELMPADYMEQVAFGPCRLVHVDPQAAIPRFSVGKKLQGPGGVNLGPFATQAQAGRYVQVLEDLFDLCRYVHILEKAPHGQACAYFEMGKCPAPCDGTIAMERYRQMMADALAFAVGRRAETLEGWRAAMEAASADLAFERAGQLKQRLERAEALEHESFAQVRPMDAFDYLIVQRAGGTTRVRPFFVRGGWIEPGQVARLKELPEVISQWIGRMGQSDNRAAGSDNLDQRSEHIWLVSHFLFKKNDPGIFIDAGQLATLEEPASHIIAHFSKPPRETDLSDTSKKTV